MLTGSQLLTSALLGLVGVHAVPRLAARQSTSALRPEQVTAYKPYTFFAGAAYCQPTNTLSWTCGVNCAANLGFLPVAAGGDGASTQFWYVGYDPALDTVIVGYQGSDASKILPLITDIDVVLTRLDNSLFPGINSSVEVHAGFGAAQARSASDVLEAVRSALSQFNTKQVTIVGHSLGGAIALITSIYLPLHLPSGIVFRAITYGTPRVGNQAFADYVDAHLHATRINNKEDPIPITPGRFLGYHHPAGEIHIVTSGAWISCADQENDNTQCTDGSVSNILEGDLGDHDGPYDGVMIRC
ncbi:putative alpha beta-hydrolase [Lyophyllum shimeji]|uniref:Alpha beta-hydrolase n=1 Tax=Lyophyllum shimeji TaxID=47721 RepID=A0A9P3PU08_LYOSH|nr:putative alpha beta-hydrolase [Lyophyllum shimeji]